MIEALCENFGRLNFGSKLLFFYHNIVNADESNLGKILMMRNYPIIYGNLNLMRYRLVVC